MIKCKFDIHGATYSSRLHQATGYNDLGHQFCFQAQFGEIGNLPTVCENSTPTPPQALMAEQLVELHISKSIEIITKELQQLK